MAKPAKKTSSKKTKRNVPNGVAHIQSTFNNTIVSITDSAGEVISWSSAGASGFKGARKGTPFAAQTAAEAAARRALEQGMRQIEVLVRGPGSGRETAIRALQVAGLEITLPVGICVVLVATMRTILRLCSPRRRSVRYAKLGAKSSKERAVRAAF